MLEQRAMEMRRKSLPPQPAHPQMFNHPPQQFHQHPPAQNMPGRQPAKQKPQVIEVVQGKKAIKVYHRGSESPKSSRSSIYSEDSYSGSGSDYTPDSSIDSSASHSSHHHRRRSHSRHRRHHHDRPEQFGIETPRRHSRFEQQHYIMDNLPSRVPAPVPAPPSPPIALPPPVDIDLIQDEAYQQGRVDERALAMDDIVYRPRTALPPRIIQRRPSVRLVDPREAFERMRLEDDLAYEDRLRYEEDFDEEMRRRRRQRLEEDALALEEERMFEERAYNMRSREAPFVQYNPLAPLGGRARRRSSYYPEYYN